MHSLAWRPDTHERFTRELPSLGRILLQTGTQGSGKFQAAVARALAAELHACLLSVDDLLFGAVCREALGAPLDLPGAGGATDSLERGGLLRFFVSFWLSGGKRAFAWDVIRQACLLLAFSLSFPTRPSLLESNGTARSFCGCPTSFVL